MGRTCSGGKANKCSAVLKSPFNFGRETQRHSTNCSAHLIKRKLTAWSAAWLHLLCRGYALPPSWWQKWWCQKAENSQYFTTESSHKDEVKSWKHHRGENPTDYINLLVNIKTFHIYKCIFFFSENSPFSVWSWIWDYSICRSTMDCRVQNFNLYITSYLQNYHFPFLSFLI